VKKKLKQKEMKSFTIKNSLKSISIIVTVFALQFSVMAQTKQDSTSAAKPYIIHQEVDFTVSPQQLYNALLSSKQFSESTKKSFDMFTAMSAKIDSTVGGTFSVFDGHIIGRIIELVPNQRIVEAWRVVDWQAGVYSIAEFQLKAKGSGTQLIFDHTGFPAGLKEHLAIGWQQHYWDALAKYFAKK
jgi:activator of HSP90 ATPase